MLSQVTAKNSGDVFFETQCILIYQLSLHARQQCITSYRCVFKSVDYTISLRLWL